ncbi:hypothetical protein SAICODRAFT_33193 [Saitoella complicata NRRL Y-17804]|nr:uncharacterized protein SAICODRAFT_33193 [Saitoella complicata NRRL Y-17804]ODQ55852.1 hypothetical protein SAICODRAFT_33193 [Saitoella complicata NRRL Y-17804]
MITSVAESGTFDGSWPEFSRTLLARLEENIGAFAPPSIPRPEGASESAAAPVQGDSPKASLPPDLQALLSRLISVIERFTGPPFTVQRIAELIARPREHYTDVGKYLRALERNLSVTSTIDAFPLLPIEPTNDVPRFTDGSSTSGVALTAIPWTSATAMPNSNGTPTPMETIHSSLAENANDAAAGPHHPPEGAMPVDASDIGPQVGGIGDVGGTVQDAITQLEEEKEKLKEAAAAGSATTGEGDVGERADEQKATDDDVKMED